MRIRRQYFILSAVAALILNTGYLVPFFYYYTSGLDLHSSLASSDFSRAAVFPAQLFMMFAGRGSHSSNAVSLGIYDESSLTLGIAGFACMGMAVYYSIFKRPKDERDKYFVWLTVLGVFTLFMSTTWFPWGTLRKIEPLNRVLVMIQFPTRFRQLAETLIALAGCAALVRYPYFLKRIRPVTIGLLSFSLVLAVFISDAFLKADEGRADAFGKNVEVGGYADYIPEGYSKSAFEGNDSEAKISAYTVHPDKVTFDYSADDDTYADVMRIYYKGYRAYDAEGRELPVSKGDGARVRIELPAGDGSVTLVFTMPSYFTPALIVSLVSLLILTGAAVFYAGAGRKNL